MAWLLRDGDVLGSSPRIELAAGADRSGRRHRPAPAVVHTLTWPSSLDVAWCSNLTLDEGRSGLEVRRLATVAPRRVAPPLLASGALVVAAGGTFDRWHLKVGDRFEIRGK